MVNDHHGHDHHAHNIITISNIFINHNHNDDDNLSLTHNIKINYYY